MGRTKPVHWCRTGGVDTFRKAPAQRETYDAIRDELKAARAGHRLEGIQARRSGRKAMLQLERERLRVIHGGAISVGRKALDLLQELEEFTACCKLHEHEELCRALERIVHRNHARMRAQAGQDILAPMLTFLQPGHPHREGNF